MILSRRIALVMAAVLFGPVLLGPATPASADPAAAQALATTAATALTPANFRLKASSYSSLIGDLDAKRAGR